MAMIVGNDVSGWQGDINWEIYHNNSNFVIVKATEGVGFVDSKLIRNQTEARHYSLPLGYYHFARPSYGNDAAHEADFFLSKIGELKQGELLCLDYEDTYAGDVVAWCKNWLDRVKFMTNGTKPLIYLNQSHMSLDWKPVVDAGYGLWLASYQPDGIGNTGQWPFMAMQQTSSSQRVPGINGNVDRDVFFGDVAAFKKYGYQPPILPTPPVPTPSAPPTPAPSVPPPLPSEPEYKQLYFDLLSKVNGVKKIIWQDGLQGWFTYLKSREVIRNKLGR